MGTVKSGWLQKLSGFFKNTWKKRYFILYQSGDFCYYQDPHDKEVDGKINMKSQCHHIAVAHSVGEGVKAPKDIDALFSVVSTERTFYLEADSASEAREWVTALEQARAPILYGSNVNPRPPVPQQVPYGYNPSPPGPVGPPPAYSQAAPSPYPPAYSQAAPSPYPMPNPASAYPPPAQAYPPQYPPQYRPQPGPYPQQPYPQQPYAQQPPPVGYRPPVPPAYPQQQYQPGTTTYVQGAQPQTVYVQNPNQRHKSSGRNNMLMGAGAGALGGAAMGYMLGRASGGYGGYGCHGYGGWDSDHSWSSGGSFDCDFD